MSGNFSGKMIVISALMDEAEFELAVRALIDGIYARLSE
jgi:hypothetical protein